MALNINTPKDLLSNTKNPFLGTFSEDSGSSTSFQDDIKAGQKLNLSSSLAEKIAKREKRKRVLSDTGIMMSYPVARGGSENTGDTFLIKCLEYVAPKKGMGLNVKVNGLIEENKKTGEQRLITKDRRKAVLASDNYSAEEKENYKKMNMKVDFKNGNQRMTENQKIKYYIELPAPQEINDSNSVTWGEDTLNALELAGLAVAQQAMTDPKQGFDIARAGVQELAKGLDIDGLDPDVSRSVRASISGAAINALGSNVSQRSIISRATGKILNSNTELLFQGVNLRSFPFSVTFTPRGPKEANVVKTIIRSLKQSMAPKAGEFNGSSATGIFLKSPDVFSLRYKHKGQDHPFLNRFKLCALTGMSVNYTNAGTYATYSDGTPVAIRMNLTFKEINPIYNEDYLQSEAGDGVGY